MRVHSCSCLNQSELDFRLTSGGVKTHASMKNKVKNSLKFWFSHSLTFAAYTVLRPKGTMSRRARTSACSGYAVLGVVAIYFFHIIQASHFLYFQKEESEIWD